MYDSATKSGMNQKGKTKISIILADDHPLMREALKAHIYKHGDMEVIGEAADGEEVTHLAAKLVPDVVIMDISMPKLNGIEATRQIKARCPNTAILVLTVHSDYERILGILAAGASGYITKEALGNEVVEAVRGVVAGETVLSTPVSRELIKYALRNNTQPLPAHSMEKLTPKELEILRLVAEGKSNKDIARKLDLSLPTIKGYLAEIYSKLKVSSRTEAVITGLRAGLLSFDDLNRNPA